MEPVIRQAEPADRAVIERIVHDAYIRYVSRIGRAPAPMNDDYQLRIAEGVVRVLTIQDEIAGLVVLLPKADYLLLDNVAVAPERQGSGLGRRMIAFAEAEALRLGYPEIRLYTNAAMNEDLSIYTKLGYQEFARVQEDGFHRVFMRKRLAGWVKHAEVRSPARSDAAMAWSSAGAGPPLTAPTRSETSKWASPHKGSP